MSVRWCYRWVHSHQRYLSWPDSLYLSSLTWSFLLQFDFECKDTIIKWEKRRKPKDFLPFLLKSLLLSIQPAQIKIFVPYQYYIFCNFLRYSEENKPSATISLSFCRGIHAKIHRSPGSIRLCRMGNGMTFCFFIHWYAIMWILLRIFAAKYKYIFYVDRYWNS